MRNQVLKFIVAAVLLFSAISARADAVTELELFMDSAQMWQTSGRSSVDTHVSEYGCEDFSIGQSVVSTRFFASVSYLYGSNAPEMSSMSVSPATAGPGQVFTFSAVYSDPHGYIPSPGYPQLVILKDSAVLAGSPFTMTQVSGDYTTGMLYRASIPLSISGNTYQYYFVAIDTYGYNSQTNTFSGPVVDNGPALTWAGGTGYTNTAFDPARIAPSDSVLFKIKYSDIDNHAPKSGYPRVHLLKNNAEISGSPFVMTYQSGVYDTGAIFSASISNLKTGNGYSYWIEALNVYDSSATTVAAAGPIVSVRPTLSAAAANPAYVAPDSPFTVLATLSSDLAIVPTGYPKLCMTLAGTTIIDDAMTLLLSSGSVSTYSYSVTLSSQSVQYVYYSYCPDPAELGYTVYSASVALTVSVPAPAASVASGGVQDGQNVTSARVRLAWQAADQLNRPLSYNLYLSQPTKYLYVRQGNSAPSFYAIAPASSTFSLAYSGTDPYYTLTSLEPSALYYWRVDTVNEYGATTTGNVFSFSTLAIDNNSNKCFNFPNPFNPHREKTRIVFPSMSAGTATVYVFTEFGEIKFKSSFDVVEGSNEFLYDGRDNNGDTLFNGSYIFVVDAGGKRYKNVLLVVK